MKREELMINDWVSLDGEPIQVAGLQGRKVGVHKRRRSIYCSWHLDSEFQPIPLTEDIFTKNGFSEIHHPGTGATDEYSEWFFGGIKIIEWLEDWKYHYFSAGGDGAPIDFQYVHQLQHLLRLAGIEKEIEL